MEIKYHYVYRDQMFQYLYRDQIRDASQGLTVVCSDGHATLIPLAERLPLARLLSAKVNTPLCFFFTLSFSPSLSLRALLHLLSLSLSLSLAQVVLR